MGSNKTPWRDIYSLEVWLDILKITVNDAKRTTEKGKIDELTKLISRYQMIDKRDLNQLVDRKQHLTVIANLAKRYIDSQDSVDVKSQKSVHDEKGSEKRHKVEIRPGYGGSVGKKEDKIDPWISSLGSRALKKRAYIEQIQLFVNSTAATNSAANFIKYIKEQANRDRGGGYLPLTPGTKMEKIDPFHRDFEFHADKEGHVSNPATDMARALQEWIAKAPDIPFFYWLEGHAICTATKYFDPTKKVAKVTYDVNNDPTVMRVWLQGKRLVARGLLDEGAGAAFNTEGGYGTKPGHAFVWLKDGIVLSHPHRSGEFHHSTFAGGSKVRCAGTWKVKNGILEMMDNNSGHYQPSDVHFYTLLRLIDKQGAVDGKTKVGTHSTIEGFGGFGAQMNYISIADYRKKLAKLEYFAYNDTANLYAG